MRIATILAAAALSLAALPLAGCGKPAALGADRAWVRLPAVPGRPAAAYFTLHGGAADKTLVAAASPAAMRAELHESMKGSGDTAGMDTMKAIGQVALPAGGTVRFAPGGKHVMLFDVDPGLQAGATTTLTLGFADGTSVAADAKLIAPGGSSPY